MNIQSVEQLEDALSTPTDAVINALKKLPGDIVVLGVAGKMGITLAKMASRALQQIGRAKDRVIGVSRFSQSGDREKLESWGIRTIQGDLLDPTFVATLPEAPNVIYMAGMKFGATGNESLTWAMNTHLPSLVCRHYAKSRIAAFSTGNVYGMTPVVRGGSIETDTPNPSGEYAMSCLGRERIFEHFARQNDGPSVVLLRLNYASELRYGVIVDVATKIKAGEPIDLAMGAFNAIWQQDANAIAIASLGLADQPASVINIAGPEILSIRRVAEQLADAMGVSVGFVGTESPDAFLSNAQKSFALFGYPTVSIRTLIHATAAWVKDGGSLLGKPTHFETRDGKY